MRTLTREYMDAWKCDVPGCAEDHSIIHIISSCHPRAAVAATYVKATGIVEIRCYECGAPVANFQVAQE